MSSQRRIDASKRNGARSRGPKTPAGKRRSSINATRHGLLAKCVVLDGESEPQFLLLLAQHQDKFAPRDDIEFGMIEDMAACYWRLRRAMAMEKCLLDEAVDKSLDSDGIPNLGKAWDQVGDSPKLLHLHRYQVMLNRMHHRALANLLMLRNLFPDDADLPIEPSPISGHSAATPASPEPAIPSAPLPSDTPAALPSPPQSSKSPAKPRHHPREWGYPVRYPHVDCRRSAPYPPVYSRRRLACR
jgi:hypothetical protein